MRLRDLDEAHTLPWLDKPYVEYAKVVLTTPWSDRQASGQRNASWASCEAGLLTAELSLGHLLAAVRFALVYGLLSEAGSSLTLEAEGRVLIPTLAQDKTPSRPCLSVLKEYWGARHGVLAARL